MATNDPLEFHYSAGGAVFKKTSNSIKWLIIKPAETSRWQLPKGHIDKGEKPEVTAVREVEEEGGVKTKLMNKIDRQEYFFQMAGKKIKKNVVFYLLEYLEDTGREPDKKEIAEAKFVSLEKALEMLTFDNDKDILKKASELL